MERTPREVPAGANGTHPEQFIVNDSQLGKSFAVRELTDEQITAYRQNLGPQISGALQQITTLLNQYTTMVRIDAAMDFELDRRQRDKALKIVPRLNA